MTACQLENVTFQESEVSNHTVECHSFRIRGLASHAETHHQRDCLSAGISQRGPLHAEGTVGAIKVSLHLYLSFETSTREDSVVLAF